MRYLNSSYYESTRPVEHRTSVRKYLGQTKAFRSVRTAGPSIGGHRPLKLRRCNRRGIGDESWDWNSRPAGQRRNPDA
jgi:hypothetical protein